MTILKKITLPVLFLSACGGDVATNGGDGGSYGSFAVSSAADLPTCDDTTRGHLYFLETENEFQTCKTSGWTEITIRGADGAAGTNGTSGLSVVSGFRCSTYEAIPDLASFSYRAVLYSNGDRWISCSIGSNNETSSESTYYQSGTNGATKASCQLAKDISGAATGGFWTFQTVSGVRSAEYTDVGAVDDGRTSTFTSGECTEF